MSDNELPNVNSATIERMQLAAKNPNAGPVFMLNLNKYSSSAGFPDGALYKEYMQSISRLVSEVEGKILWWTTVNGQVVWSGSHLPVAGLNEFVASTPYTYTGGDLVLNWCFDNNSYGSSLTPLIECTFTPGTKSNFGDFSNNSGCVAINPLTARSYRPNLYMQVAPGGAAYTYSWSTGDTTANLSNLVAFPTPSIRIPVAGGSKVPEWPTLRVFSFLRARATTSWLVQPGSLSTTTKPL